MAKRQFGTRIRRTQLGPSARKLRPLTLVVLPVLREQRTGQGEDVEPLVSRRTGTHEVQPGNPENLYTLSDNQSVGYETCHQEETWHGLGTSVQEGRPRRFTTGLLGQVGRISVSHQSSTVVYYSPRDKRYLELFIGRTEPTHHDPVCASLLMTVSFLDSFLDSPPPAAPSRPVKICQLIIALIRCMVNVMQC